jgi:hypothetical protein
MDERLTRLLGMIGIPFCCAGGLSAFLITYEGYMRGEKPDKRLAFRMALQTALVALVVLAVITIAIGFALASIIE